MVESALTRVLAVIVAICAATYLLDVVERIQARHLIRLVLP